jgi:hypothetical protein
MTQVSLNINERLCYSCGKNTRNPIYCCKSVTTKLQQGGWK